LFVFVESTDFFRSLGERFLLLVFLSLF
jgi:hypothetical protein